MHEGNPNKRKSGWQNFGQFSETLSIVRAFLPFWKETFISDPIIPFIPLCCKALSEWASPRVPSNKLWRFAQSCATLGNF